MAPTERRRGIGAICFATTVVLAIAGCSPEKAAPPEPSQTIGGATAPSGLVEQTRPAGDVEVTARPERLDSDGASITITLDTHTTELDQDLASSVRLEVDGTPWPTRGWDGDPPSGHHRSGTLGFDAAGPAIGTATLTIDGFDEAVTFTWQLGA